MPPLRAEPSELMPPPLAPLNAADASPADEAFAAVGRALAAAKAPLDAIPPADFEPLMRALDLYASLKRTVRRDYGLQVATNASLKMFELLTQMGLLACESGAVARARAFCNAELPGAFVAAINHYVRTRCPATALDWVASSYYPAAATESGDTSILGDHYGLYAGSRDRWLMGPPPNALPPGAPPVTGDLTDARVVAALAAAVHARFAGAPASGATLYTSDAGIDVSADYNRQEELTALLNYGQVLCGVLTLAPGGHLVTKQYTFLSPFSRGLVALLAALFDELYVAKPLTSRPGNSEVYLVGKGFRGIDPVLAEALLRRLAEYRAAPGTTPCDWTPLLDPALTADVDAALLRVARQLHERQQVAFLREAEAMYREHKGRLGQLERVLGPDARRVQEAWLCDNAPRRIRADQLLPAGGYPAPPTRPAARPRRGPQGAQPPSAPPSDSKTGAPAGGGAPLFGAIRALDDPATKADVLERVRGFIQAAQPRGRRGGAAPAPTATTAAALAVMERPGLSDAGVLHELRALLHGARGAPQACCGTRETSRLRDVAREVEALALTAAERKDFAYLDIGCSEGHITTAMAQALHLPRDRAHACDVLPSAPLGPVTFTQSAPTTLPYESSKFDFLSMFMSAHHFTAAATMFDEARRVAREGARLLIREHDSRSEAARLFYDVTHALYACVLGSEQTPEQFVEVYAAGAYATYRSQSEWVELIRGHGFEPCPGFLPHGPMGRTGPTHDRFDTFYAMFQVRGGG